MELRVKICGITKPEQACTIAQLGATAIGFICVSGTPRYIAPQHIRLIVDRLPIVDCVGVFLNAAIAQIEETVEIANLNVVQLHGAESPQFCEELRSTLPNVSIIKAVRIRSAEDLEQAQRYQTDFLLLDAYHPAQPGGTGHTIDWQLLKQFRPDQPWYLAGGLNPSNVLEALSLVTPDGIDLSSGLENAPGDKNLERVEALFQQLSRYQNVG